jgi:hypothetical protein
MRCVELGGFALRNSTINSVAGIADLAGLRSA